MWLRPKRVSSAQTTGQPFVLSLCAGVVQFSTDGDIRYATTLWLSLNFCSSNFNWTAALLYSGKVPCSSAFRTHGFSVCSCSLSLVRARDMSSVLWIGWNLNHCFISFGNLTNNAEQSASSETDCPPSGQQIPSCFLSRRIRYFTKIAVGWMWRRVIWLPLFCKNLLPPSSGCRRRCWERFIFKNSLVWCIFNEDKFWNIFCKSKLMFVSVCGTL
jgi:hypothetical protein